MEKREREKERDGRDSEEGIVPSMLKVFVSQLFSSFLKSFDREWEVKKRKKEKSLFDKTRKISFAQVFRKRKNLSHFDLF